MENIENFKIKIYLAGWSKDLDYRKIVKEKYGKFFDLIDPMLVSWDNIFKNVPNNVVDIWTIRKDKKLIEKCDILIAKIEYLPENEIMVGTFMEILYAFTKGIPVFIISSQQSILDNIWLKFHSKMLFKTIDECFDYIKGGGK